MMQSSLPMAIKRGIEPVPEEGFQVEAGFAISPTVNAEALLMPQKAHQDGGGGVAEQRGLAALSRAGSGGGEWKEGMPSPARAAGGLTNAIAAATSNNAVLERTAPADRPQPGTSAMRDFFVLPWNSIYFNASYGNVPWPVMQAQWALQAQCEANPQDWMLSGVAPKLRKVRRRVAEYVNCEHQDLVLVENCTSAANAVLRALPMPAGGTVVHLSTAYGVVKNVLAHVAEAHSGHVVEVPVEFRGHSSLPCGAGGIPLEQAVARAIDDAHSSGSEVVLGCFDHIASCPGVMMPVLELARVCRERGVPVMLDGAHVLGQQRVDLRRLEAAGVDYWISDAHKWLFSPKGSAVLWVTREKQHRLMPSALGAVVRSAASMASFRPAAVEGLSDFELRFQYTGTRDYTPLAAISAAMDFRDIIGEEAIVQYNHSLAVWANKYLSELWGTQALVADEATAAMAHVMLPVRTRAAAQTLARLLKKRCNIHVMLFGLPAAGDRTGETYWVRPCCQIYNSRSDYETLGHKVLEWAPLASAADKALLWLRKVRPNVGELAEREEEEEEPAEDSVVAVPIFAHSMGASTKPAGLEGLQMATAALADPRRLAAQHNAHARPAVRMASSLGPRNELHVHALGASPPLRMEPAPQPHVGSLNQHRLHIASRLNPAFAAGALGHGAINGSPDSVLVGRSGMGDRCESWNSMDSMTSGLMHSASGLFNQAHGW